MNDEIRHASLAYCVVAIQNNRHFDIIPGKCLFGFVLHNVTLSTLAQMSNMLEPVTRARLQSMDSSAVAHALSYKALAKVRLHTCSCMRVSYLPCTTIVTKAPIFIGACTAHRKIGRKVAAACHWVILASCSLTHITHS